MPAAPAVDEAHDVGPQVDLIVEDATAQLRIDVESRL
jgi:hypothetical protein